MADVLKKFNEIDKKTLMPFIFKILADSRIIMTIILIGASVYLLGYDTVLKGMNEQLSQKDAALKAQEDSYKQQKELVSQYQEWQTQLKELNTDLFVIDLNQPATVAAASMKANLLKLIQGEFRNKSNLPPLPAPNDLRQRVEIIEKEHTQITLSTSSQEAEEKPSEEGNQTEQRPGGPNTGGPMGPGQPGQSNAAQPNPAQPRPRGPIGGGGMMNEGQAGGQGLQLEKFEYEVHVTGTYAAMADLLNELVSQPNLVVIRSVKLLPAANDGSATQYRPDPKATPDAPVKVDLILLVTMYLYQKKA